MEKLGFKMKTLITRSTYIPPRLKNCIITSRFQSHLTKEPLLPPLVRCNAALPEHLLGLPTPPLGLDVHHRGRPCL
jgi:hypothetical protein